MYSKKIINQSYIVVSGIFVEYQFSLGVKKNKTLWEKLMKISSFKEVCFTLELQLQVVNVKIIGLTFYYFKAWVV